MEKGVEISELACLKYWPELSDTFSFSGEGYFSFKLAVTRRASIKQFFFRPERKLARSKSGTASVFPVCRWKQLETETAFSAKMSLYS